MSRTQSCFSFGSNLDENQMLARCPSARPGYRAVLPDYALTFTGFSHSWGGAVASVVRSPGAHVFGVVYLLSTDDLVSLDRFEGHPFAYERVSRIVVDERRCRRRVCLYQQPAGDLEPSEPAPKYYEVLQREYARLGFDRRALSVAARGGR
jgi:hypothetical protein